MTTRTEPVRRRGSGWAFGEWTMGIIGGISAFLGLFILLGNEEEFVGLGGDWSWRVGEIDSVWGFGLLIGGAVLLIGALTMALASRRMTPVESTPRSVLLLHAGVFLVVNAFIWMQDFATGEGLDYAYWTTIPWALGLLIHALVVVSTGRSRGSEMATDRERDLVHH